MMALALLVAMGAWSCGDNDNSGPTTARPSAALQCEVMGSLCHDAEGAAGRACHERGHDGPPDRCAAEFPACIGECLGDGRGDPFCRALGSYCHAVDDEDGPLHACHELGHDGDPRTCRTRFDDCAEQCLAARGG
jgi:hypothetical protein